MCPLGGCAQAEAVSLALTNSALHRLHALFLSFVLSAGFGRFGMFWLGVAWRICAAVGFGVACGNGVRGIQNNAALTPTFAQASTPSHSRHRDSPNPAAFLLHKQQQPAMSAAIAPQPHPRGMPALLA